VESFRDFVDKDSSLFLLESSGIFRIAPGVGVRGCHCRLAMVWFGRGWRFRGKAIWAIKILEGFWRTVDLGLGLIKFDW
jgi:hypothetical protein